MSDSTAFTSAPRTAADDLRDLLAGFAGGRAASVGQESVAVAGDIDIHAETGGAAAWQMGSVQIGRPPSGPAGSVPRLTAPGTLDHLAPPSRKAQPGRRSSTRDPQVCTPKVAA